MDYITYENTEYPIREIMLPEFGHVLISVERLSSVLLKNDYSYNNKEAQFIDEKIFFFVSDDKIHLSTKNLKKYFSTLEL